MLLLAISASIVNLVHNVAALPLLLPFLLCSLSWWPCLEGTI